MKFSVIIPAYNAAEFIERCMYSVINQTYQDVELIIVNDGSKDNTEEVVKAVIENNKNFQIKYTKIQNSGPSSARNRGIEMAEGDYICFLDSDDSYDINLFYDLSKIEDDYDVCFFGWQELYEDGQIFSRYSDRFSFLNEPVSGIEAAKMKFNGNIWLCNCNEIYSRAMIEERNLRYPEGIYAAEDTYFIYSCLVNAKLVRSLDKDYFYNTFRENSLMHATFSEKNLGELKALNALVNYAEENIDDEEMKKMFSSLHYYSHVALTKRLARTVKWYKPLAFKKLYSMHIPKVKRDKTAILTKMGKIEDTILHLSPMVFFEMCKLFYFLKGRRNKCKA